MCCTPKYEQQIMREESIFHLKLYLQIMYLRIKLIMEMNNTLKTMGHYWKK